MLEIGSVVDGKYKILNKIGQGGMSVVYLAINEAANKPWAIKEVRKDGTKDFEVVRQGLIVETDMLKRLNHPNLPSIIDVIDRDDTFLIVMDYIEGRSLADVLKETGAQPQEYVIEWAKQLCDVLGYLHSRKPPIIYRDMKPSNVMLRPDGNVTLIDFGTAREFKNTAMVEDTTCLGTQGYAAPEQFGGHGQTDARTDIYCLGATIYHLVTGHNPAKPPYEMYPIRQWNQHLSSGLEQIILKCINKDPEKRYQSCSELMYALDHFEEMDYEYRRGHKRRLFAFGATLALSLGLFVTAGFMSHKESSTLADSYDSNFREAKEAPEKPEFKEAAKAALASDGSNIEIYNLILDRYENDFQDNESENDLTSAEYKEILDLISPQIDEELKKADPVSYYKFCYRFGVDIWANVENSNSYAVSWLSKVQEYDGDDADSDNERMFHTADTFIKINEAYSKSSKSDQNENDRSGSDNTMTQNASFSYADYWKNLEEVYNDTILHKGIVEKNTQLYVYKKILHEIWDDNTRGYFIKDLKDGKTKLRTMVDNISKQLNDTKVFDETVGDYSKSLHNRIKDSVDIVYDKLNRVEMDSTTESTEE